MDTLSAANTKLVLAPLGAGDLIDRTIRIYRQNFWTLLQIAAPPVVLSTIGAVLFGIGWREMLVTDKALSFSLYFTFLTVGLFLRIVGFLAILMVMGGAARNLVRHLLYGEPISVRETYRNLRGRFWGLLRATLVIAVILSVAAMIIFYVWLLGFGIATIVAALFAQVLEIFSIVLFFVCLAAATVLCLWLFFLIAGCFAYIPQAMLVEGQSVGKAFGRSASLAIRGNVKRLAALVCFCFFATYSALSILLFPVYLYAYFNGIELFEIDNFFDTISDATPIWFVLTTQLLGQLSLILLSPVLQVGLSLLYVDERVRQEGYDIELMAARNLGEVPAQFNPHHNPLQPVLADNLKAQMPQFGTPTGDTATGNSGITTIGLK